jgi:hypothetical protein
MEILLAVLTGLALLRAAAALGEVLRLRRLVIDAADAPPPAGRPPRTAVLAPCKGVDPDMPAGLAGLLNQDHPDYEVVFALESPDDPAAVVVAGVLGTAPTAPGLKRTEIVFTGPAADCGQKIHNLRAAMDHASPDAEVLAFLDSDVRPDPTWLRKLIAPLAEPGVGVSTGYRWYLPLRGGAASAMLSAWNAVTVNHMAAPGRSFAWGGSMALTRDTFAAIRVPEHWAGSVSDDGSLTRAARSAGLAIRFVPGCLVMSRADTDWAGLWEFVARQFTIVRVYAAKAWAVGLVFTALAAAGFFGGPAAALLSEDPTVGWGPWLMGGAGLLWGLNIAAGAVRLDLAGRRFPGAAGAVLRTAPALLLAAPALTLLNLAALVRAGLSRRITWRGISYVLHSPNRLTVLRRE